LVAGLVAVLTLAPAATAPAHVRKAAGALRVELGWADEPAYAGARNAVEVRVADRAGAPVADPRAALRAEVRFGAARRELALKPAGEPGAFAAAIVPTRPGVYAFHVTGALRSRQLDVAATCSERTFHCVESAGPLQFPLAEPSAGDLDRKLARTLARAERAEADAERSQTLAIAALAASVLALLAAAAVALPAVRRR
jgi:hypothetical protein